MIVEAAGAAEMEGTAMDGMVPHSLIHVGKNLTGMVVSDVMSKVLHFYSFAYCSIITNVLWQTIGPPIGLTSE